MPDIAPRVGRVIRRFREDRGYSQERLAETAGLHRTYISLVERGQRNISVDALNQIAEALDVYASRLLAVLLHVAGWTRLRVCLAIRRALGVQPFPMTCVVATPYCVVLVRVVLPPPSHCLARPLRVKPHPFAPVSPSTIWILVWQRKSPPRDLALWPGLRLAVAGPGFEPGIFGL
ncbi:MAG: helix-turn-helix transcriptional regulator [Chloroflexi bacterium]|nr:helix-turn-helix transcriptional regulator [Chloroflexota bacterium]